MAVLGRGLSIAVGNDLEITTVLADFLREPQVPFRIFHPTAQFDNGNPVPYLLVQRDRRNQEPNKPRGYGAGTRLLFTINSCQGECDAFLTPVVALLPDQDKNAPLPLQATLLESVTDPIFSYDSVTEAYHVFYWVNVWSPASEDPPGQFAQQAPLFPDTEPAPPATTATGYFSASTPPHVPPSRTYTAVREVPELYTSDAKPQLSDSALGSIFPPSLVPVPSQEIVGPPNISSFWVAPWSDGHLYRFDENYDPTPPPPTSPTPTYSPLPGPPLPPPPAPPAPPFGASLPRVSIPAQGPQQAVNDVLYKVRNGQPLKPTEVATLQEYALAPQRLAALCRTTRVLMYAKGQIFVGLKQDVEETPGATSGASLPLPPQIPKKPHNRWLVLDTPKPIAIYPRTTNKMLSHRSKWVSWVNGSDIYVTAPLNFSIPGYVTLGLSMTEPQVDFTIHDQTQVSRLGPSLPFATVPQLPFQLPQRDQLIPRLPFPSLIGVTADPSVWQAR